MPLFFAVKNFMNYNILIILCQVLLAESHLKSTPDMWRNWLETNGRVERKTWVLARYASSTLTDMRMNEVIAHALCYGWTDNKHHKQDDDTFYICFMPRNPKSVWGVQVSSAG